MTEPGGASWREGVTYERRGPGGLDGVGEQVTD